MYSGIHTSKKSIMLLKWCIWDERIMEYILVLHSPTKMISNFSLIIIYMFYDYTFLVFGGFSKDWFEKWRCLFNELLMNFYSSSFIVKSRLNFEKNKILKNEIEKCFFRYKSTGEIPLCIFKFFCKFQKTIIRSWDSLFFKSLSLVMAIGTW